MKICHISDKIPLIHDKIGGAEWAAYRIIKAQRNMDKFVITSSIKNRVETNLKIYDVPIKFEGLVTNIRLGILPFNPSVYKKIKEILKNEEPDIVHLHNFKYFCFSALKVAKDLGIKVVHSVYDYWLFCPLSMLYIKKEKKVCKFYHGINCSECFSLPGKTSYLRKLIFDYYIKMIDHFIVISQDSKNILIDNGIPKNKISISNLVVDNIRKSGKKYKKIKNTVLYAGWIVPHKGLDVLIKGLNDTNYKLFVAGEGTKSSEKYVSECKKLAQEMNVDVEFLGKISNEEVIQWMKKCEFLVIPERWRIPLPTVMIEAMIVGSKVVGSNIGCIKYCLPKNNLFNDEKDLVKSLKSVKFLKGFPDNKKTINGIEEIYKKL